MSSERLWVEDGSGRTITHALVSPNSWQGEVDCLVGPFSGRNIAEYFAGLQVDFGQFDAITQRVFARGDAWYIKVEALQVDLDDKVRTRRGQEAYSPRLSPPVQRD